MVWGNSTAKLKLFILLEIRNSTINSIALLAGGQTTLAVIQQTPQEEAKTHNLMRKSDRDYLAM